MGGVLAVSRAFGDRFLKRYVVAHPEVAEELIGGEDDCLVLASDGVWDVLQVRLVFILVSYFLSLCASCSLILVRSPRTQSSALSFLNLVKKTSTLTFF